MQRRAFALDVREERREVTVKEMLSVLKLGEIPIILINAQFLHQEDAPQWVVVRGYSRRKFSSMIHYGKHLKEGV